MIAGQFVEFADCVEIITEMFGGKFARAFFIFVDDHEISCDDRRRLLPMRFLIVIKIRSERVLPINVPGCI